MSRRPRDCCRVPDLFVMQQPLAQLLTIGSTTISIQQSIQPRCQIMLCLLCLNNQQRLMMLMKKIGFGCPAPGLSEVLGSPRTCARRWCEVQQSSNIFLDLFGVFSQVVPKKNSSENGLNCHIPSAPGSWWKMWKRHLCWSDVLHVLVLHQMHWHPDTSSAWGKWVSMWVPMSLLGTCAWGSKAKYDCREALACGQSRQSRQSCFDQHLKIIISPWLRQFFPPSPWSETPLQQRSQTWASVSLCVTGRIGGWRSLQLQGNQGINTFTGHAGPLNFSLDEIMCPK